MTSNRLSLASIPIFRTGTAPGRSAKPAVTSVNAVRPLKLLFLSRMSV